MPDWGGVSPALALVAGVLVTLLAVALVVAARRALMRREALARQRRGHEGELQAPALLNAAGWRVIEAQPPAELALRIDGAARTQPLRADYLCEREGRVVPAEVKTGRAASTSSTRRQLLEYAVAYGSGAALLVDADAGTVQEVEFPEVAVAAAAPRAPGSWLRPFAAGLVVGACLGGLLGWWLLSRGG